MKSSWTLRASSCARLALCPGSARATWGLDGDTSDAAESGTRIHSWLADVIDRGESNVKLSADETRRAMACMDAYNGVIANYGCVNPITERAVTEHGWAGHIDLTVFCSPGPDILIDWKTGDSDPEPAESNAQMRVYAALHGRPCEVLLITPRGVHSRVKFSKEDIAAAVAEITAIREAALAVDAARIPGPEACQYCPAFGGPTCPETQPGTAIEPAAREITGTASELTPARLAEVGRLWKIVQKAGKLVEDEIRSRLEVGIEVPGCQLRPGGEIAVITDPAELSNRLVKAGIGMHAYLTACKPSITALTELLAFAADLPLKQARARLMELAGDTIEKKAKADSLIIK